MVSAAKPKIGGGIWTAPYGTAVPTDATTALSEAFVSLGYISEDGVARSTKKESTTVKAWGGTVVAVLGGGKTETLKFTMLDADNVTGLGLIYGEATGTLATGITVKSTSDPDPVQCYVVDMILADNVRQRLVVPAAVVTDVGDVTYADGKVEGHEVTITAMEEPTRYVVEVADTGKGIPKSQWSNVFQPGYTTKQRGWGLGLSLAKRIVEEYHHGRIFVKSSEAGQGTTFRIELKKS
jgi:hypothetical protein